MSKALENAFAKMEAEWAFKAKLDDLCATDPIYSSAKILAENNKPNATSFDQLVSNELSGRAARRKIALKAMSKRRAEISRELKSTKSEAA